MGEVVCFEEVNWVLRREVDGSEDLRRESLDPVSVIFEKLWQDDPTNFQGTPGHETTFSRFDVGHFSELFILSFTRRSHRQGLRLLLCLLACRC